MRNSEALIRIFKRTRRFAAALGESSLLNASRRFEAATKLGGRSLIAQETTGRQMG